MAGNGPDPQMTNTLSYQTERLTINLPKRADADTLYDLVGGPDRAEVCATLLWDGPDSIQDTLDWIAECETGTFGDFGFHWTVRDTDGVFTGTPGTAMGAIGTRPRAEPGRADVGYWLGRPFWGQGIMGEALRGLLHLGFTRLDYYKMEADVYTINGRGLRLVESVGMQRECVIRQAYRKQGRWVDAAIYGILREEWESSNTGPDEA